MACGSPCIEQQNGRHSVLPLQVPAGSIVTQRAAWGAKPIGPEESRIASKHREHRARGIWRESMANGKRVGVLTGGGDCPGLNAVIRGVVKSASTHGYEVVGFLKGYEGLVDPVSFIPLTHKNTTGILGQGGTILGSTNKGRFAATVGVNDRVELDPELIAGVKTTVEQLSLEGLICVGGDGSLAVAQQFHEHGIPVVGVPKTIDNDLSSTAFTFGFFSAVFCATDALDRLHTTAASHERVMVLEVMGRHAGWIALYAGIAGGGDVILIPEIPWTFENLCQAIISREQRGKKFTLVVVAEGD